MSISFDDPVGAAEQRRRHTEAEGFRGLEIDHQLELFRGLDGQFAHLRALLRCDRHRLPRAGKARVGQFHRRATRRFSIEPIGIDRG